MSPIAQPERFRLCEETGSRALFRLFFTPMFPPLDEADEEAEDPDDEADEEAEDPDDEADEEAEDELDEEAEADEAEATGDEGADESLRRDSLAHAGLPSYSKQ